MRIWKLVFAGLVFAVTCLSDSKADSQEKAQSIGHRVIGDESIHVPEFDLPVSALLSQKSKDVLRRWADEYDKVSTQCPAYMGGAKSPEDVIELRNCLATDYFPRIIARQRDLYKVTIESEMIAGVPVEVILPSSGLAKANRHRVLINLHGGGFIIMGKWGGEVESIPIAAIARIKVISIEYRMAPEFHFPAATEDVTAVYKKLLRTYRASDIGIYGCSAGGILTAESVAWFRKVGLPKPAAIGMFCAAATVPNLGDSNYIGMAIWNVQPPPSWGKINYFSAADYANPLAFPALDPLLMGAFPPSLLISGTRDPNLSDVLATHALLTRLGVPADLHVWEGMGHGFLFDPELPESQEAYHVVVRFFEEYLGRNNRP